MNSIFNNMGELLVNNTVIALANFFALLGGITMLIQGFRFVKMRRFYRNKIKDLEESATDNMEYVINLSGHKMDISEENWLEGKKVMDIPYGNIHDMKNLEEEANMILERLNEDLIEQIKGGRPIIYALPGMSILAQVMMVKLHALSGSFPIVTFAMKKGMNGFVWTKPMDLHIYRTNNRTNRWKEVK